MNCDSADVHLLSKDFSYDTPMPDDENLKKQRDRFLSFSFATSDLLLEVNGEGHVSYALGAIKGMTSSDDAASLVGTHWLDIFSPKDRLVLKLMLSKAQAGSRCGPVLVALDKNKAAQNIIVSGIKMPGKDEAYLSLANSNALMNQIGMSVKQHHEKRTLDKETFIDVAQETLRMAGELGQEVDMTLIDIPGADKARKRFGKETWDQFSDKVNDLLCDSSIDGGAAAKIGQGQFSVLHEGDIDVEALSSQIEEISKEEDPFGEGLEIKTKSISADMSDMNERDATRALFYTLSEFERQGTDMTIENLNSSFKAYVAANTQKIQQFKKILDNLAFSMHFQPIVNLETVECTHYEMLCRFQEGNTFEWVMFGEDIGMAAEFDMAVCKRALTYISKKRKSQKERFSINISGQSIGNEAFFTQLMELVAEHSNIKNQVIFEITESTQIQDLDQVGSFIKELQEIGLQVALDDFGAGAASFQYLNSLHVDYVKIDGKYIRNILHDQRDMIMVKNLTQMCKDLDIKVIGEFVENKEIADTLLNLGIDYGQGYYFGKPAQGPQFFKPE